jgi:hypothetical protein
MSNKQQTAVEFYIEKLADILDDDIVNKLTIEQTNNISFLTKQAKEIEREQIKDAHLAGQNSNDDFDEYESEVEYYNETYGGNK